MIVSLSARRLRKGCANRHGRVSKQKHSDSWDMWHLLEPRTIRRASAIDVRPDCRFPVPDRLRRLITCSGCQRRKSRRDRLQASSRLFVFCLARLRRGRAIAYVTKRGAVTPSRNAKRGIPVYEWSIRQPVSGNIAVARVVMAGRAQMEFQNMAQAQAPAGMDGKSQFPSVVELRQSLPSRVKLISSFVDQLMRFVKRLRNEDESDLDIEIALREALINAVVHGNREHPDKRVYVTCRCTEEGELLLTVRDEGQGFDHHAVLDPTAPENILSVCGRGIYLMRALMDEIRFEGGGTAVNMRKKPKQKKLDGFTRCSESTASG
jgi:serine/threonine-protein kinase RsbW